MNGAKPEKTHFLFEMFDFITERIRETGNRARPPPPNRKPKTLGQL
jgi:hypothetical protein